MNRLLFLTQNGDCITLHKTMAPQRGSNSYSSYRSSAGSMCSQNDAFASNSSRIDIAFGALYLLIYIGLFCTTVVRFFTSRKKRTALKRWFLFGVSIIFMIIEIVISIIMETLYECGIASERITNRSAISVYWLYNLGRYALFVIILLPICRRLHQQARNANRLILIAHSICLALLGLLLICAVALETKIIDGLYGSDRDYTVYTLMSPERDLHTALYVFEVIAMLMAAASMIVALLRAPHLRKGTLGPSLAVLIISCLGLPLTSLAGFVDSAYRAIRTQSDVDYTNRSQEAQTFIANLFYSCAFLSALLVAGSRQLADDSYKVTPRASMQGPVYAPQGGHPIR
ncbi:hypothetical protein BO78DRAFT_46372 [Aspergillus sclerotiicarbonarius CBS 121057]|uniref:Integral membrane protein n=1 Tax=Aspergillus sclerotiicarbonarius (strain CBS 121057 / IBT 28362) TaxID=1448318 RepID=A0A319EIB2_ASPSB|nr:hypothetical protein BO78DRAFT_46372 [Aspergillus sclerotiicarbonarius CBS 121057]